MRIITIYSFYFSFIIFPLLLLLLHFVPPPPTFAGCDDSNVSSLNNW
jgi:hypothetical protein